jgi:hypothetical protein
MSVWQLRYLPRSPPRLQTDGGLFPKYYAIATGTILFYDYLLTLADEVCKGCSSNSSRYPTEITFYRRSHMHGLERNRGVRTLLEIGPSFC